MNPGRNLGKTNALNEDDLAEFVELQKTKADSENSWSIDVSTLGEDFDLSVKNPNKVEEKDERTPAEIFESIEQLHNKADDIITECLAWDLWPQDNEDGMENLFAEPVEYDEDDDLPQEGDFDNLSEEDRKKVDSIDAQIMELEKKMRALREPINNQIDALLEQKISIFKKNRK